jgi:hypothetical protein
MTLITLDGTNNTLLTAFTPSVGGGFVALSTSVNSAFTGSAPNRLKWAGPVNYTVSQYAYTIPLIVANYTVSTTFRFINGLGPTIADTMAIRARSSSTNRAGYILSLTGTTAQPYSMASDGTLTAIGTSVTYASVGIAASALDTDYIGTFTVNGTALSATFRGVSLFSGRTDSTFTEPGYAGIGGNSGSSLGSAILVTDMTIEMIGRIGDNKILPVDDINKSQVEVHTPSTIAAFPAFQQIVVRPI